jgi:hypothetical protein
MGALQSHLAEHIGFAYRNKIELALGVTLPNQEDELPEAMEKQISRLMAEAAPQVLNESKALVAQQQAQQNAQDPVLQIQMQELQIKQQDQQRKSQKDQSDAALKAAQIQVERDRIEAQQQSEGAKLMAKTVTDRNQIKSRQESEGFRTMAESQRHQQQMNMQRNQQQKKPTKGD